MAKSKRAKLNEGDILVMKNEKVCRVRSQFSDYTVVTWITDDEDTHLFELKESDIEEIISPTPETVFTFNVAHGLHQRLNRFKNL